MKRSISSAAVAAFALAAGCDILGPKHDDVGRFLTLSGPTSSPPNGFFDGTITRDAAGCYRTANAGSRTVIWPLGAYARVDGSRITVYEATGQPVGTLEGSFRLVGNNVADLQGQSVSADTRQLASQYCPGTYFLVEDVVHQP